MGSYVPSTKAEREEMLSKVGVADVKGLYAAVPSEMMVDSLDIPAGMSELEVESKVSGMAKKNKLFDAIFRGSGA